MKASTKKQIRFAGGILFVMYILLLIYFLFFAEWYGRGTGTHADTQYNFIPFWEIMRFWHSRTQLGFWAVFLNLGGNIIGFLPFGFIMPILHPNLKRGWLVILMGCLLSCCVECLQFIFRVGSCDIDDVILNTTGTAVGYLLFTICNLIRRHHRGKRT